MRTPREQRLRDALFLAVGIGTIGIVLLSYGLGVFDNFERQSVDARFSVRGARKAPNSRQPPSVINSDTVSGYSGSIAVRCGR